MAPSSSSSSPSSSSKSPSSFSLPPPHHPSHFTPIQECDKEEQEEDDEEYRKISTSSSTINSNSTTPANYNNNINKTTQYHHPTPLHEKKKKPNTALTRQHLVDPEKENTHWVSCNKCRPHARDKISVVPLDHKSSGTGGGGGTFSSIPSPNTLFRSIFSSLTKRSPKSTTTGNSTPAAAGGTVNNNPREEQWKMAIAEVSHKLIQVTRRRDEAVLEASRLRSSLSELEKKLNKLEIYCHNLKSGLDKCTNNGNHKGKINIRELDVVNYNGVIGERVIEQFLVCVSEARSNVRLLSRALTMQLRHVGGRVFERLSLLLQPYDVKVTSFAKNPKGVIVYLEALLNRSFFEDFESVGFHRGSAIPVLNPIDRCEANYASFNSLTALTWEEVLTKGTRHFSEEFSKFCDRKMSEIVSMLGWNKAWPEPLLQAFFGASKSVWLVHLLANSLHPGLPIFRVGKCVGFDPIYMEDMGGGGSDQGRSSGGGGKLVPTTVRIMVAPGFYVYGNVVKCKVLCRYYNNNNNNINNNSSSSYNNVNNIIINSSFNLLPGSSDKGLTRSP